MFLKRFVKMEEQQGEGGAGGAKPTAGTPAADAAALAAAQGQGKPVVPAQGAGEDAAAKAAKEAADAAAKAKNPAVVGEEVTFAQTGNSALDVALGFLGKHGFSEQHPALIAASKGDLSLLKAHFAQNPVPGWDTMLALGEQGYKALVNDLAKKEVEQNQKALELAGSEEALNAAVEWANANAEPHEKEQFNKMMEAGGFMADAALFYIINQHKALNAPEEYSPRVDAVRETAAAARGADTAPLSRAEFAKEAKKLVAKFGDDYINRPEFKALGRRLAR